MDNAPSEADILAAALEEIQAFIHGKVAILRGVDHIRRIAQNALIASGRK